MGKMENTFKNPILAKEGNKIDVSLQQPPTTIALPPEPIYEEEIEQTNAQAQRENQLCNVRLKVVRMYKSSKVTAQGFLCEDEPWNIVDQKAA